MKKVIFLIIFVISISGYSKNNNEKIKQPDASQLSQPVQEEKAKEKEFRYVNSIDGLRIRNKPGRDGKKIGSLKNKEKIEVISETSLIQTIDEIKSNWLEIKTENDITGYVFGGFLEKDLETIDIIQNVGGEYKNKAGWLSVTIKYKGMQEFIVSVTVPFLFEPKTETVRVNNIYKDELFYSSIDGRGGLGGSRTIKFDNDKNLIWKEDIYECDFDEDYNPINETETHNMEILEKIT